MNVLYTCDDNYVWIMGISVISLFENNKHIDSLNVYLLGENISHESKDKLNYIAKKYNRQIIIIDVPKFDIPSMLITSRWPLSAFTRLYSAQLLPANIDKILYLDCDTIISGSIGLIDDMNFKRNIVLGVKDCISGIYKENIGLDKNELYINAGVLLINLEALRKINISVEIEKYLKNYIKLINYADQDVLNGIFKGKIGELSPCYNVMTIDVTHSYEEVICLRRPTCFYTKEQFVEASKSPVIIHYTTNMLEIRPWYSNTNHPLANEFKKYMLNSPWKNKELREMIFDSKEAKIISLVDKLPKRLSLLVLGLLHAELKPRYKKIRGRRE